MDRVNHHRDLLHQQFPEGGLQPAAVRGGSLLLEDPERKCGVTLGKQVADDRTGLLQSSRRHPLARLLAVRLELRLLPQWKLEDRLLHCPRKLGALCSNLPFHDQPGAQGPLPHCVLVPGHRRSGEHELHQDPRQHGQLLYHLSRVDSAP